MIFYPYSREEAIQGLCAGNAPVFPNGILAEYVNAFLLNRGDAESGQVWSRLADPWSGATQDALRAACLAVGTAEAPSDSFERAEQYLRFLAARFEITGRVYARYAAPQGSAAEGEYTQVENYVLLAAALAGCYARVPCLAILNTLLKLNDLLIRFPLDEFSPELSKLMLYSLAVEKREMQRLYASQGYRVSPGR
ncbi:MAG: hypothetical protein JXR37_12805 [Kiritimatiellae bacterium]|nr:hypothetical protein [Kiritimatiellia bacterium]